MNSEKLSESWSPENTVLQNLVNVNFGFQISQGTCGKAQDLLKNQNLKETP